jgi:Transposase IS4
MMERLNNVAFFVGRMVTWYISVTTAMKDKCFRRQQGGCQIECDHPTAIEEYNQYMGGVDSADQCQKHCDSTIMGQHRWWLKLFHYLLDVATANALVLYNEAMNTKINVKDFKKKLVLYFIGSRLETVPQPFGYAVHELVQISVVLVIDVYIVKKVGHPLAVLM